MFAVTVTVFPGLFNALSQSLHSSVVGARVESDPFRDIRAVKKEKNYLQLENI